MGQTEQEIISSKCALYHYEIIMPYLFDPQLKEKALRPVNDARKAAGLDELDADPTALPGPNSITVGDCLVGHADANNALEKLRRREAHLERCFRRTLHEFQRVQAMRKGQAVAAPIAVDLSLDGTAA